MNNLRISLFCAAAILVSCDDDDVKTSLRKPIDYAVLTPATPYGTLFIDASGNTTVNTSPGNDRLKMFLALNHHNVASIASGTPIDAGVLGKMFSNSGNPFYDITSQEITISGTGLNASPVQLRNVVASSLEAADADVVRERIENYFTAIALASQSLNATATAGHAGMLGSRLVDARGLDIAAIIASSLVGAMQLDYISNVLLDEGLDTGNSEVVADHNYTELEHNWDIAYGLLTLNPVYLAGATDADRKTTEFGAGSYLWEYNKANYARIFPAFLKGRAAIVNNDHDQYRALATFIRMELEKSLANAAIGSLGRWKTATDDAARAHTIGEAIGLIYSLRFAALHEGSATWADTILENLVGSGAGFWDLTTGKVNSAITTIDIKFND